METEVKYLYLVLSKESGVGPYTTVHASEDGAKAAIANLGYGGMFVARKVWDGEISVGMKVRVGSVSTPYDEEFRTPTIRDESHDASWGRIVEVLP